MNKTLIGICTFGNLPFTQLTINSIRASTRAPIDFFVVVGKPNDTETSAWLTQQRIAHHRHDANYGFPVALNDIMDYAWASRIPFPLYHAGGVTALPDARPANGYDNLIIVGNDIVPYSGAVDAMIEEARRGEWEWICSSQFDVKSLVMRYPETLQYFTGSNWNFEQWLAAPVANGVTEYSPTVRPWEAHQPEAQRVLADWIDSSPERRREFVQPNCIKDVRNLCLFRRSVFEKIGYADVNFWPGGYFEDNDYCTRARKAGVKACGLQHSGYFHFWSRTIHQGDGTKPRQFQNNAAFYATKWGGGFDAERWSLPFTGQPHELVQGMRDEGREIVLPGSLKISGRSQEAAIVEYWTKRC